MHWGTFNLALHAWDDPAETLLELAPRSSSGARRAELVMPMLGQPVEPARVEVVVPWWRAAGSPAVAPREDAAL